MLSKCANPICSASFRRISEGKLFYLEATRRPAPAKLAEGGKRPVKRVEHFWLCGPCSTQVTLSFDSDRGMLTVPRQERPQIQRTGS